MFQREREVREPVLAEVKTEPATALEAITIAVEANQEPSASDYILHYCQLAAELHKRIAAAKIECETNERAQGAAVACLIGLGIPG
jgi:hypothetical protein